MPDSTGQTSGLARTLSIKQACAYAGVSRRTIYNWMAAGKLTRLETPGGSARFWPHELVRDPGAKEQNKALCFDLHAQSGARCQLPAGHVENHKGEFAHGIAQWPR